jgi:ribosomal protein S18 acetylase RimI-like enzyme
MENVIFEKADISHLQEIVKLLIEDDLGKARESLSGESFKQYKKAFKKISEDKNQYLAIGKIGDEIVATCHLTIMPSLTLQGSTRLQIEAVRVKIEWRGKKIGEKMIDFVKDFAVKNDCNLIQLTTNKSRDDAKRFYERVGFEASHIGMKLKI